MTKYINICLVLVCASILLIGCSRVPDEQKNQGNLSEKNPQGDTEIIHEPEGTKTQKNLIESEKGLQEFHETKESVGQSAEMAIEKAGKKNKYLFLVFYKQGDQSSKEMKRVVGQAEKELSARANVVYVDIANESEQATIKKYGIDRSPIPITLVMAPNGAIVTGFPGNVNEDQLRNAFVSPKMAEIVKAIQDRKLVFLLVTNDAMKYSKENIEVAEQVAANELQGYAEVIVVDPRDEREVMLLKQCQIDRNVNETMLVFINGGRIMCKSTGRLTPDGLLQEIMTGCSPSGCK